jgi:hypothetical protein
MGALCFWQSCSTIVVFGFFSSGKGTAHIIHVFVLQGITGTLCYHLGYFLGLCFTSQNGSFLI